MAGRVLGHQIAPLLSQRGPFTGQIDHPTKEGGRFRWGGGTPDLDAFVGSGVLSARMPCHASECNPSASAVGTGMLAGGCKAVGRAPSTTAPQLLQLRRFRLPPTACHWLGVNAPTGFQINEAAGICNGLSKIRRDLTREPLAPTPRPGTRSGGAQPAHWNSNRHEDRSRNTGVRTPPCAPDHAASTASL